jgi:hypothetical protein
VADSERSEPIPKRTQSNVVYEDETGRLFRVELGPDGYAREIVVGPELLDT